MAVFFETLWTILSGKIALAIYISVLVVSIVVLIVYMVSDENKRVETISVSGKTSEDRHSDKTVGDEESEVEPTHRFYMLSEIDEKMANEKPIPMTGMTLEGLCESFRNYSASKLKLYYSKEDIRKFIASMAVTHIVIMQGMSGTGKTSLAYAFGEYLGNSSTIVPIQPMWKERTDLIGYYNEFTGKFNETTLLEKMYEANYSKAMYVTVLDEMNIARVEYYFAEFLSLLEIPEAEGRYIDVVTDKKEGDPELLKEGRLRLPTNMWYIGTANNDDSTFAISDKVYDRAMIMNLDKKTEAFIAEETEGVKISVEEWEKMVKGAKEEYKITARNKRRIKELDKYMIENYHITFGNRITKQISEYVPVYIACGGKETEAIDDIMSKKVLRKLETQNPVYVRKTIGKLIDEIEEIFGEGEMPYCKEYLQRLEKVI